MTRQATRRVSALGRRCWAALLGLAMLGCPGAEAPVDAGVDGGADAGVLVELRVRTPMGRAVQRVAFVAFQDGDGPWRALPADAGTWREATTTGRYGFAVLCGPSLTVSLATTAEQLQVDNACAPDEAFDVTAHLVGWDGGSAHLATLGAGTQATTTGRLSLRIEPGPRDFVASLHASDGGGLPEWVAFLRDVTPDAGADVALDFAAHGGPTQAWPATVSGADPPAPATVHSAVWTQLGTQARLSSWAVPVHGAYGVPSPSALVGAEVLLVYGQASAAEDGGRQTQQVVRALKQPEALALALPPKVAPAAAEVLETTPCLRLRLRPQAASLERFSFDFYDPLQQFGLGVFVEVHASRAWLAAMGGTVDTPSLATVPGWPVDACLRHGALFTVDETTCVSGFCRVVNRGPRTPPPGLSGQQSALVTRTRTWLAGNGVEVTARCGGPACDGQGSVWAVVKACGAGGATLGALQAPNRAAAPGASTYLPVGAPPGAHCAFAFNDRNGNGVVDPVDVRSDEVPVTVVDRAFTPLALDVDTVVP